MKQIKKISTQEFIESFENVPRVAVSLVIQNKNKQVLLAKRNIPPSKNKWHLPGSFLIKNEKISDNIKRILKKELGYCGSQEINFKGVFENIEKDPRGHVLNLIYELEINDLNFKPNKETKEVFFFKKLPKGIGFNHQEILNKLGFN